MNENRKIIFFDGVCNLCNSTVDFLMRNNPSKNLFFSSLQSPFAKTFLSHRNIDSDELNTIYYFDGLSIYKRSAAVFEFLEHTSSPYRYLRIFRFVPTSLADAIYGLIARNRYRLLGKRDSCRIPTEDEQERFID